MNIKEKTKNDYAVVIGGVNIDITGFPYSKLISRDSNIGKVELSLGGVGRNISENLVRLGINTKLISILGDDIYGKKILDEAEKIGLDMKNSKIIKGSSTSTYLAVLDNNQDMAVAIASMDIYEQMTVEHIEENRQIIENSKLCILDTNIPEEVIKYIVKEFKNVDFFVDTVSTAKALKIKELIRYIHTIKTNKLEVEAITGINIKSDEDLKRSWEYLKEKGLKSVFITLGKDGVYYSNNIESGQFKANDIKPKNTTGAGDAFTAGLGYCYMNSIGINESAKIATASSLIALSHENTINPNISIENINKKLKEIELC